MATYYQIRVAGHLDQRWCDWFDGLTITHADGGMCVLSGCIRDQAQLHGLLARIRDLALPLISVNPVEPDAAARPGSDGSMRS